MSSRTPDTPAARVAHARRSLTDRLVLAGFDALTRVLPRLPDRQLHRAAQVAGAGLYLAWPTRRALVRSNLERVSRSLTARGMASPRIAHAARDPRALDALVRSAFGHYLRSYLEVALAPGITRRYLDERISVETPATARQAFAEDGDANGQGRIFVALHLGSIELPGFYAVVHGGRPLTAPMETLRDPAIQDYLERSRSASGVRIVPVRGSVRGLAEALARG